GVRSCRRSRRGACLKSSTPCGGCNSPGPRESPAEWRGSFACRSPLDVPGLGLPHVRLDLVVVLGLVARLVVGRVPRRMGLDLRLLVLALLVRHCSSFGISTPFGAVFSLDVLASTNLPIDPSNSQPSLQSCPGGPLRRIAARIRTSLRQPSGTQYPDRRRGLDARHLGL